MNTNNFVLLEQKDNGIAELILNRPEIHNAFDDQIISALIDCLEKVEADSNIRALVLRSNGKNFSAGADLAWMKRMAKNSHQENLEDAAQLANLMQQLNQLSKPSIALIQGATYGGAVGLAACCDIVIASEDAKFCLSEVRIGLIPAVISPYVIRAIGEQQARRYFLTAEAFSASKAKEFGLVHEITASVEDLEQSCKRITDMLQLNSPQGMKAAKDLIFAVSQQQIYPSLIQDTAKRIADIRVSDEGQEGLTAFLEKRQPNWIQE